MTDQGGEGGCLSAASADRSLIAVACPLILPDLIPSYGGLNSLFRF
jgi:hypothetical protein